MPEEGRVARVIRIQVIAWDVNCQQHLPQKRDAEEVARVLAERDQRIAELERALQRAR